MCLVWGWDDFYFFKDSQGIALVLRVFWGWAASGHGWIWPSSASWCGGSWWPVLAAALGCP